MFDRIARGLSAHAVLFVVAIAATAAALSSCAGNSTRQARDPARSGENTGTFPNLNIPPKAAAAQLTEQQKREKLAELEAEKHRLAAEQAMVPTVADSGQLKKLGDTHGRDTLKAIEQN